MSSTQLTITIDRTVNQCQDTFNKNDQVILLSMICSHRYNVVWEHIVVHSRTQTINFLKKVVGEDKEIRKGGGGGGTIDNEKVK